MNTRHRSTGTRILDTREACDADIDDIMALEESGFGLGIRETREVFSNRIRAFPAGFLMLVDPSRGGISIGYICSELWEFRATVGPQSFEVNHDISTSHRREGTELYISSMTVLPALRGQGAGSFLFERCINHVRERHPIVGSVILMVNETWEHARRIYVHNGFSQIARFEGFFHPVGKESQAAIIMRKQL